MADKVYSSLEFRPEFVHFIKVDHYVGFSELFILWYSLPMYADVRRVSRAKKDEHYKRGPRPVYSLYASWLQEGAGEGEGEGYWTVWKPADSGLKVRGTKTKHIYIKITTVYVPSSELRLSPTPSLASDCAPPPGTKAGGHTLLRVRVEGVPIPTTGEKLSTLPTLWWEE